MSSSTRQTQRALFYCFCGRFCDQEMLLAINFDGKSILKRTLNKFGPVVSKSGENRNKRTFVSWSHWRVYFVGRGICIFVGSAFQRAFLPPNPHYKLELFPPMKQKLVCTSDIDGPLNPNWMSCFSSFFFSLGDRNIAKNALQSASSRKIKNKKKQRTMQESSDGKIFVAGHSWSSSFQPHTRRRRLRRRLAAAVAVVVVVVVEVSSGWQLNPSPVYPGLQVQLYEPSVFSQFASLWQLWRSSLHSLTSKKKKNSNWVLN